MFVFFFIVFSKLCGHNEENILEKDRVASYVFKTEKSVLLLFAVLGLAFLYFPNCVDHLFFLNNLFSMIADILYPVI